MTSEFDAELNQYDYEKELNARTLAEADAEAEEAIAAADEAIAEAKVNILDHVGVIQIDDDDENVKPKGRKPMASRSEAWDHFKKVFDVNGVVKEGLCKYCDRPIQATTANNGTSSMLRHLTSCKKNPHRIHDPKQGTLQATPGAALNNWKFDPEALRKAFAEMVIEDELPFAFGEKSGFIKFMSKACPRFKPPSRRTCAREVVKTYLKLIEEIEDKAKGKRKASDCSPVAAPTTRDKMNRSTSNIGAND